MISAAAKPISSEVRPAYMRRTISSRPRRPSAPRKNLPSAREPLRPDRRPVGADDVLLFAADVDPFQGVGLFGPGVGDVVGPERRRRDEDEDRREEDQRGDRDPVGPQPAVGDVPGAAARHYLNWKLVRSPEKIGFQITLSKSMSLETKTDEIGLP